jgi:hypothetical protein
MPVREPGSGATTTPTTPGGAQVATQSSTAFGIGDVFVAVGDGKVQWRLPDGTLNTTLDTGLGGFTTGMAFDKLNNLYVTGFTAGAITRFDPTGSRVGTFGTGYNCNPESITFDAGQFMYVGQAGCSKDILRFNEAGSLVNSYDVPTGPVGSDWTDLSVDQCTMLYTSEGPSIRRFNVCTNAPMSDLTGVLSQAFALRIISGGQGILVADRTTIKLVDNFAGGRVTRIYDAPNQNCWFALNLDPDGDSFWSADFCSSMVFKFDIASGTVLQSFSTGTPSNTVFGLVVNGEFSEARNRSCASENITLGQVPPTGGEVVVRYDPRYLVDESRPAYEAEAEAMAERIRSRAVATLAEYRDQLGFSVPDSVTFEIRCEIRILGLAPVGAPGVTESENLVKLRADHVRFWMLHPTNSDANATWKTLVDHELQHTIQVKARSLVVPFLNQGDAWIRYSFGDATNTESGAQLAQDLIADSDDAPSLTGSYLSEVAKWFGEPTTIAAGPDDTDANGEQLKYRAAPFIQYLGERFGTGSTPEKKVAEFLRRLYGTWTGIPALGLAVPDDTYDLLREFYVSAHVRLAPNANEYPKNLILDEILMHGGVAGPAPDYPPLAIRETKPLATAEFLGQHLEPGSGAVFVVDSLGGASSVRVKVSRFILNAFLQGTILLAFVPIASAVPPASDGPVFVDPRNMPDGPVLADDSWTVPMAGQTKLAILVVTRDNSADFDLTVQDAGGSSAIDLLRPTAANPAPPLESACPNTYIPVTVRPTVDGTFDDGLAAPAFTASIHGAAVPVTSAVEHDDDYLIHLLPATKPSVGNHAITVTFNGVTAPQAGQITVVQTTTCSTDREGARIASLGTLGQGEQASANVPVATGDAGATFGLTWSGSDFDLILVSPSGRTITETTVANDVHVVQGSSRVTITLDGPEGGSWTVRASGVDVPSPEPVSYDLTEIGTAVRSELSATTQAGAGDPIAVRLALTDDSVGLVGAAVEATITDPAGIARHFRLFDDGGHGDTSPSDGVYGTLAWATELTGSYDVAVSASATRANGTIVERQETVDLVLGQKLDADGDGVANWSESVFGLDPGDPGDGSVDFDADGRGLVSELAAGLDPFSWDSDAGGENDASESVAGRDPRRPGDDHAFAPVLLSVLATDGNLVRVSTASSTGTGQVHLYRLSGASRTDLGLRPSTDSTFDDGPLPSGTYRYIALGVAADGAESAPQFAPPVKVAADVTPPFVRMSANDGVWATIGRDARIVFTDLSEPVTEMRLAESEADLAAAPWIPYANPTIFTIGSAEGRHFIVAQVRDAAGTPSSVVSTIVDLDTILPASTVSALPTAARTQQINVAFTAADAGTGLRTVELYARSRPSAADPWGAWTLGGAAATSPISYSFPAGDGLYEFYTVAIDLAGNRETVPSIADASTIFDRGAPTSLAGPLDATYSTATVAVPYAASDSLSGVASVELWSRYRATSSDPWGAWAMGPIGTTSPITYTFGADGEYGFYTIGIDGAGNREAAPASADATTTKSSGATWSQSVRVNDDPGTTQQDRPAIALGPDGATYLIWDDYRPGTQADIYFSRRDPSTGTWSANQKVNNDTSNRTQYQADIAVDGSNNAFAVWQDPRNGSKTPDPDIYFSKRSASTGTWSSNVRVNGDTQGAPSQYSPAIAVKSDGAAVAVWVDRRSNQWNIYSARLAAGGTMWGSNIRVTTNTSSRKEGPDVVVGSDGTAYAVWEDDRTGNSDVWFSKLTPGSSTWTAEVKISDDSGARAQYGAHVAIDAAGNLMVIWLDDRPYPRTEVRMSRLSAGSSTWPASVVVSDAPAYAVSDALGVKGNGNAFAVWQDARGPSYDIWGSYYNAAAGTWSTPTLVSDDPGSAAQMRPAIAMNNSEIAAAWTDNRAGNSDIRARRRTPS